MMMKNKDYEEGYRDAILGLLELPKSDFSITINDYYDYGDIVLDIVYKKHWHRRVIMDPKWLETMPIKDLVEYCFTKNIGALTEMDWEERFKIYGNDSEQSD